LNTHPLPSNISYVSIIGTGQLTLAGVNSLGAPIGFLDGDGIVSKISQDLMTVTVNLPQQKSVGIDILIRECANKIDVPMIGNIGETHTCETTDIGVGAEILSDLQ
jgi:triacylglycerol lipase